MIIIGVTGSIGTGKSTVTQQFAERGAVTLDSDVVVHELLAPAGAAVAPVARIFPESFEGDHINRQTLGKLVFSQPEKRKVLEAIVHPLVREAQEHFIKRSREYGYKIVVLDIPLLFETGGEKRCDFVIVTQAPLFIQKCRVLKRPNMTSEKFERILAAQMPAAEKCKRADFVVHTGFGKALSMLQVKRIIYLAQRKSAKKIS